MEKVHTMAIATAAAAPKGNDEMYSHWNTYETHQNGSKNSQ